MKPVHNTPEEIRAQIWKELVRATRDRHHVWRTPVLATTTPDGMPNARTVVLRKASKDEGNGVLEIYTDRRSPKVAELNEQPAACLVFWSSRLKWQLRLRVQVSIQTDGPYVESLWQTVKQSRAAGDYLGFLQPGEPVSVPLTETLANTTATDDEPENYFAVLTAQVVEIDWLELGLGQHRRARFTSDRWQWVKP